MRVTSSPFSGPLHAGGHRPSIDQVEVQIVLNWEALRARPRAFEKLVFALQALTTVALTGILYALATTTASPWWMVIPAVLSASTIAAETQRQS